MIFSSGEHHAYPPPPPADSTAPDGRLFRQFLNALGADLELLGAIEQLLRPFNLMIWRDPLGKGHRIVARPQTATAARCDWPNRTYAEGDHLRRCDGADALGHGDAAPLGDLPVSTPAAEEIYRAMGIDGDDLTPAGQFVAWLLFTHTTVPLEGADILKLASVAFGAASSQPADTSLAIPFPISTRDNAGSPVETVALGAIELRHTPEPTPVNGLEELPPPLPLLAPSGGSSGSGGAADGSSSSSGGRPDSAASSSSYRSSSSSGSSPASSSSSGGTAKMILPINRAGRLQFIGWCAVETPCQMVEHVLTVRTDERGYFGTLLTEAERAGAKLRTWEVVDAWAEDPYFAVCATKMYWGPGRKGVGVIGSVEPMVRKDTIPPGGVEVHVVMRAHASSAGRPWAIERDRRRVEASRHHHQSLRRHA